MHWAFLLAASSDREVHSVAEPLALLPQLRLVTLLCYCSYYGSEVKYQCLPEHTDTGSNLLGFQMKPKKQN